MLIRKIFDKNDKNFEAMGKDNSRRKQKSELYLLRVEGGGSTKLANFVMMFNGYLG